MCGELWARFVSEEPLGLGGGINPYVYASNDPINGSDPSGMSAQITCTTYKIWQYDLATGEQVGDADYETVCSGDGDSSGGGGGGGGGTGADKTSKSTTKSTPKWRSMKCALSALALGAAVVETGAVGLEAGAAVLAADGLVAAGSAIADVTLTHMADVGTTYLAESGAGINTNATIARTMLNHIYKYGEGAFVAGGLGHGFGISGYLKDITPGVNVFYTLKDAKEACR